MFVSRRKFKELERIVKVLELNRDSLKCCETCGGVFDKSKMQQVCIDSTGNLTGLTTYDYKSYLYYCLEHKKPYNKIVINYSGVKYYYWKEVRLKPEEEINITKKSR